MKKITGWKSFAEFWHLLSKPIRPLGEAFEIYEKFIRKIKKRETALILGATPELRELAGTFFKQVVFIDLSIDMILEADKLVPPKYRDQIMVRGNWLSVPLRENFFDLILADVSSSSLSFNQYKDLFYKINKLLKKNSFFITRQWIYVKRNKEFIEEYLEKRQLNNVSELLLIIEEFLAQKDNLSRAADVYKIFKLYQNKMQKLKPNKNYKFFVSIMPLFKDNPMVWSIPLKNWVEKEFKKFFSISQISFAKDHYLKDSFPIYLLKKK